MLSIHWQVYQTQSQVHWKPPAKPKLWHGIQANSYWQLATHTHTGMHIQIHTDTKSVWKLNSNAAYRSEPNCWKLNSSELWSDFVPLCHWLKQMGSTTSFTVSCNLSPRPFVQLCVFVCVCCYINKINIYIEMQRNRAHPNWISVLFSPILSCPVVSCPVLSSLCFDSCPAFVVRFIFGQWSSGQVRRFLYQFNFELCRI